MAKIWRWAAPIALAGGLVAGLATVPAQAASISAYTISIQAKNPHFANVTGDTLVGFRDKADQNAIVSGTVTGAVSGDVVTLLAKPFRATLFTSTGQSETLTSATQSYSFSVRPTLVTKYEAQVTTGSTVDATSRVQPIYVTLVPMASRRDISVKCNRVGCTETIKTKTAVPASAFGTETRKHFYMYLGVNRSRGIPSTRPPKYLTLSTNSSASKPKRISPGAFEVTLTFRIAFDGKNIRWFPAACTKDTVTKDGLGLPGRHGCGARRVRSSATYLG